MLPLQSSSMGGPVRKRFNLYYLATVLLLIFFAGHTLGGVVFHKDMGLQEESVWSAMKSVHFSFNGADCSYFGFHMGYGLLTAIFLLPSAFLTWRLGKPDCPSQMVPISWALFLTYVAVSWISFEYFFAGPGIIATLVALILGFQSVTDPKWK
jgi:hypothetical protein